MGCGQSSVAVSESVAPAKRRQSVVLPPPDIPMNVGSNVKFHPPPNSKVIVIFGRLLSSLDETSDDLFHLQPTTPLYRWSRLW